MTDPTRTPELAAGNLVTHLAPTDALRWHAEPKRWHVDAAARALHLAPDAGTDFWQRTHYGFQFDNGHFLHAEIGGDFVWTARVTTRPVHQYDQAGLMVRISDQCWLKTSIEFEPGRPNRLGAVVTNHGYSDWSTQAIDSAVKVMHFRVRAEAGDFIVETAPDGVAWEQLRMARLLERSAHVQVGPYACSPKGEGFEAVFDAMTFTRGRVG